MIELILPYPPSVNHYKRIGRVVKTSTGKVYQNRFNTRETKSYFWQVLILWRKTQLETLQGAIGCHLEVYPPDRRKRDIDGILKVCLDSLQHAGVLEDDNQIKRLIVEMKEPHDGGKIITKLFNLIF